MSLIPNSKLPNVGTTIFSVMSALAQEHKAINLGQGFPDFSCDPVLMDALNLAMRNGHNQYPPMPGSISLRQAIAQKVSALYRCDYDWANQITVTAGATQAILCAILAIANAGDEVIVLEPCYDSYVPNILLAGAVPVLVPMTDNFSVDWALVEKAITPRTRCIITNSPHNPSARVFSHDDMLRLQSIVSRYGLLHIADEVYEHMVFDGAKHLSAASYPELAQRSFVISSFGKTYHVTGWKIAYCLAPDELTKEFRKVHQFTVFSVNTPAQEAFASYMQDSGPYLNLPSFYQGKRDTLRAALANTGLRLLPCEGTYFQVASFADLQPKKSLGLNVTELGSELGFARWLTKELGVTVVPLSAFYQQGREQSLIRFCFAKQDNTLEQAAQRLQALAS